MTLLLQANTATQFLPVWAQIVLLIFVAVALFFQWRHSIAISEFNVVKQSVERLRDENRKLLQENQDLKTKTDLKPLLESFHNYDVKLDEWKIEARGHYAKAMTRLEEIRAENIAGMQTAQQVLLEIADKLAAK